MAISKNHIVILSLIFINLIVPLHSMESRLTDEQKSQLLTYFATSFLPEKRLHLDSQILSMSFSPNPQKLMIGSLGGMVEVDLQTEQTKKLDSQIQAFHAYSPDYTKVAFVSKFRDVRIGDSLENIHTRFSEESDIVSMAFSSDNTLFACGLSNNSVAVHNLQTNEGKVLLRVPLLPEEGRYKIYSLTFSPDGTQLVSGANDGLLLWDIAHGRCTQLLYGNPIMTVAVRPQTNEFVTGNANGVLRVWDFEKQRCKQSFDVGKSIESLAFTADGKWLVIGDSAALRLCNCQTKMSTVLNLLTNFDSYTSTDLITLSPDGNDLVTKSFACNVVRDLRGFYKLSEKLGKDDISDEELVLFKKYAHNPQFHPVMKYEKLCQELGEAEGSRKFRELKHAEGQQWSKFTEIMAAFNQE